MGAVAAMATVALCALGLLVGPAAGIAAAMSGAVAAESVLLVDVAAPDATPARQAACAERRARRRTRLLSCLRPLRRRPALVGVLSTTLLALDRAPHRGPPDLTD
jgi:hypothetical protein